MNKSMNMFHCYKHMKVREHALKPCSHGCQAYCAHGSAAGEALLLQQGIVAAHSDVQSLPVCFQLGTAAASVLLQLPGAPCELVQGRPPSAVLL